MNTLETYPERLQNFYYATLKRAQHESDDTKLLKDLLTLISENI